jgi:hypothetical protein
MIENVYELELHFLSKYLPSFSINCNCQSLQLKLFVYDLHVFNCEHSHESIDQSSEIDQKFLSKMKASILLAILPVAYSQCTATGKSVTVEGYIMDNFCIERGVLFDNPSVSTLSSQGPLVHTIHCLIDIPSCVRSGYSLLKKDSNNNFSVWYKLGSAATELVLAGAEAARASGQTAGYKAKFEGIDDGTDTLKCIQMVGATGTDATTTGSGKSSAKRAFLSLSTLLGLLFV